MDIRMPVMDGLAATRELTGLTGGAPAVVILTTFDDDEYLYEALAAGASGLVVGEATVKTHVARILQKLPGRSKSSSGRETLGRDGCQPVHLRSAGEQATHVRAGRCERGAG